MATVQERGFQGNLSFLTEGVDEQHIVSLPNETCSTLTFKDDYTDKDIDYTPYPKVNASATGVYKKLLVLDNECSGKCIVPNTVISSDASTSASNEWTLEGFTDGWFSSYIFLVENFDVTATIANIVPGIMIHYTNTGEDPLLKTTGYYTYVGEDATWSGTLLLDDENWQPETSEAWMEFASLIEGKGASIWYGEYGLTQHFVLCGIYCALKALLLSADCCCEDGCDPCALDEYHKVKLRIDASMLRFCQDEYAKAQAIIQSALGLISDNNCNVC